MNDAFAELRSEYETEGLSRSMLAADPVDQFDRWMADAIAAGVPQANAMVLATADGRGRPSSRAVLLKDFDEHGFVFFTNLESRKGEDLASNPWASLCFLWVELHRQVRIDGPVDFLDDGPADAYFASRPRQAQIASAVSPQSRPLANRAELESLVGRLVDDVGDGPVPRPDHWRGARVRHEVVEFWQGRAHRLHDRLVYARTDQSWDITRLAP